MADTSSDLVPKILLIGGAAAAAVFLVSRHFSDHSDVIPRPLAKTSSSPATISAAVAPPAAAAARPPRVQQQQQQQQPHSAQYSSAHDSYPPPVSSRHGTTTTTSSSSSSSSSPINKTSSSSSAAAAHQAFPGPNESQGPSRSRSNSLSGGRSRSNSISGGNHSRGSSPSRGYSSYQQQMQHQQQQHRFKMQPAPSSMVHARLHPLLPSPPADPQMREVFDLMGTYVLDPQAGPIVLPSFSHTERKAIHEMAEMFGLEHQSIVSGGEKAIQLSHRAPELHFKRKQQQERKMIKEMKKKNRRNTALLLGPKASTLSDSSMMSGFEIVDDSDSDADATPPMNEDFDQEDAEYYRQCRDFVRNDSVSELTFPTTMTAIQRRKLHAVADMFGLEHTAMGRGDLRFIRLTKVDPRLRLQRSRQSDALKAALLEYKQDMEKHATVECVDVPLPSGDGFVVPLPRVYHRTDIVRYANWNIEWMDFLFASDFEFHTATPSVPSVNLLCQTIAGVIEELRPDIMAVIEGPARVARMELFIKTYLKDGYDCVGGLEPNQQQQVYFLIRKDSNVKRFEIHTQLQDFFEKEWIFDVNGDFNLQSYKFTRRPLAVQFEVDVGEERVRKLIAVCAHTKSKFINGGRHKWNGTAEERNEFIRLAVKNRRRIAAECLRIRKGLDDMIFEDEASPLVVVSGDWNDGPGQDLMEQLYLLSDSVEALIGSPFAKTRMLEPLLSRTRWVAPIDQWTCEFDDYIDGINGKRCLLDHICVSHELSAAIVSASVAHDIFNQFVTGPGPDRGNHPSDHRPVYCDISREMLLRAVPEPAEACATPSLSSSRRPSLAGGIESVSGGGGGGGRNGVNMPFDLVNDRTPAANSNSSPILAGSPLVVNVVPDTWSGLSPNGDFENSNPQVSVISHNHENAGDI